jgi:AsmA protein
MPDLTVEELKITNGSATVSSIPITNKPFQYTEVNATLKSLSFLKSFPFELSAKLPGECALKLGGNAGPISQKSTTHTPFQATLQLKNFDPVASGVIDKSKGLKMQSDVDGQLESDGATVSSTGKIKASGLQLSPGGSPAQEPVDIDFAFSHNIETRKGTVSDIAIHTGAVAVHANGSFQFMPQEVTLDLHIAAPSLPIDQLERLLPVVGIHLPGGSSLRGGTLTANIAVTGPATTTTLAGPVEIDNTKLAGFDLASKIESMPALSGTSGGTQIQVLKANVNSSPQSTRITNILGNLPQLGSATGEGTIAESGAINFSLNAKLNTGSRSIPLTITGTATNPSIRSDAGAMLR